MTENNQVELAIVQRARLSSVWFGLFSYLPVDEHGLYNMTHWLDFGNERM